MSSQMRLSPSDPKRSRSALAPRPGGPPGCLQSFPRLPASPGCRAFRPDPHAPAGHESTAPCSRCGAPARSSPNPPQPSPARLSVRLRPGWRRPGPCTHLLRSRTWHSPGGRRLQSVRVPQVSCHFPPFQSLEHLSAGHFAHHLAVVQGHRRAAACAYAAGRHQAYLAVGVVWPGPMPSCVSAEAISFSAPLM